MTTWDWALFELLNFDGTEWFDATMRLISGILMWLPLYVIIIYIVYRHYSWRGLIAFLVAMGVAIGLADVFHLQNEFVLHFSPFLLISSNIQ